MDLRKGLYVEREIKRSTKNTRLLTHFRTGHKHNAVTQFEQKSRDFETGPSGLMIFAGSPFDTLTNK